MALLGIVIYGIIAVFQLITLPVEYDASRRAKAQLVGMGLVQNSEAPAVGKVLNAAALTYVAAMVTSLLTLIYWIGLFRSRE